MAYVKPGVEVTQLQQTVSPTLIAPDLAAVVVGQAYKIAEIAERPTPFTYSYNTVMGTGSSTSISLFSGVSNTGGLTLASNSIYVDIKGTANTAYQTLHIPPGHTSLGLGGTDSLTITHTQLSGLAAQYGLLPSAWVSGVVEVGWRAQDTTLTNQFLSVESGNEIESFVGKRIPENPLGFGLHLATSNSGRTTYFVAMSGTATGHHSDARDLISGREVYAIAPVTMLTSAEAAAYATHASNRSTATEKMERVVFGAISHTLNTGNKTNEASAIAATSQSLANKRFFSVYPPAAYTMQAKRHISTLYPSYLDNINGNLGLYAILGQKVKVNSSTTYYAGQEITYAVWSGINTITSYVDAYVPVPGSFFCAAIAGQVSGEDPEQGFTNLPIAGIDLVKYSNDYFTQSQLNTIATGGTYIIHQSSPNAVPTCRHQLSTDMSSIETRELSITKILDYTSKFIRTGLTPYIGTYNITDKFIKNMTMILNGMINWLIRETVVEAIKILNIEQSSTEKDTILVTLEIKVPYPVNYIKITLAF